MLGSLPNVYALLSSEAGSGFSRYITNIRIEYVGFTYYYAARVLHFIYVPLCRVSIFLLNKTFQLSFNQLQ